MYKNSKSLNFSPFRTRARIRPVAVACTIIAATIGGCNMSDADWQAAKYCGYDASRDTAGMCRQARKQQSRDSTSTGSASNNRAQSEANRKSRDAANLAAYQREYWAARKRNRASNARVAARWKQEVRQARLDEQYSSSKYPSLSWFSGIWCHRSHLNQKQPLGSRKIILGRDRLKQIFLSSGAAEKLKISEQVFTVKKVGNDYEFYWGNSVRRFRVDNDNQYTIVWAEKIDHGTGRRNSRFPVNATLVRCSTHPGWS